MYFKDNYIRSTKINANLDISINAFLSSLFICLCYLHLPELINMK